MNIASSNREVRETWNKITENYPRKTKIGSRNHKWIPFLSETMQFYPNFSNMLILTNFCFSSTQADQPMCSLLMYQSNRRFNVPPGTSGHFNFWKICVQIPVSLGQKAVQTPHYMYSQGIQSNKIEPKINRTQLNTNRSIGFGNQTKSNIYFAVSLIFEPIKPIKHNRTQSNTIELNRVRFCSKSFS